jgi:hypothetical protein
MTQLSLDHLRYIQDQAYRREVLGRLRRLIAEEPRGLSQMTVVHEAGDICCLREPWPVTYAKLMASLTADGERVLGVVLG